MLESLAFGLGNTFWEVFFAFLCYERALLVVNAQTSWYREEKKPKFARSNHPSKPLQTESCRTESSDIDDELAVALEPWAVISYRL